MKQKRKSIAASVFNFFRNIERRKAGVSEKSIMVGNHRIVYLDGGLGEPILLLHGFGGEKDNWTRFASYMTERYRVIAVDNPGFADSTKLMTEKYDLNSQIKRLHEFVTLLGLKKFHIAGNSLGGMFTAAYAEKYPDEILTVGLFDAAGINNKDQSEYETLLRKGVNPLVVESPDDYDKLLDFVFATPPKVPGFLKKYLTKMAAESSEMNKKIFEDILPEAQNDARFKKIKARTLIIWGDRDRVFPVANAYGMQKLVKKSEVIVLENCGHMPMFERPEETAKHYLAFLAK